MALHIPGEVEELLYLPHDIGSYSV